MSKVIKFIKKPVYYSKRIASKVVGKKNNNNNTKKNNSTKNNLKLKSEQEYLSEIRLFTRGFDVNKIKLNGEHVWPYLRQHFWLQLYLLGHGKVNNNRMVPERMQFGSEAQLPYHLRSLFKDRYGAVEISDIEQNESVDFLFFTMLNASEQVELTDGSIYYRLTDPLYEIANKIGNAKKIEMLKVNTPALDKIKKYRYKALHVLPPHIHKSGYSNSLDFYRFTDVLTKRMRSLQHNRVLIEKTIDWEFHTRDYFIDLLKKIKPKYVFVNGFHYYAPMLSAADYLGIKTIDIQHGLQVGWNPLYNDWSEMPSEGYKSLPDQFFVWGQKEFDSISEVFRGEKHNPVIIGNPWLERQLDLCEEFDKKIQCEFDKYSKKVLVVLQNQNTIPKLITDLIDNSSSDTLWIVRHHPKGKKFVKADFNNKDNVIVSEYIDKVSLSLLLMKTDATISGGSTVSWEADYFGHTNFIFSEEGRANYWTEINTGQFHFVESFEQFYEVFDNVDLTIRASKVNAFKKVDIESVLSKMLAS